MAALKHSKQRDAIVASLMNRTDHPTADMIYNDIREIFPNISLGTVYRNLSLLSDLGEIIKITTGDGKDRFDGNTHSHNHFVCTSCHQVIDLEMEPIDYIKDAAQKNFDGEVKTYTAHFYGICGDCIKKS